MTNYSVTPGMVRVDFFKESGKWYMTEDLDMSDFWDYGIGPGEAVEQALEAKGRNLKHFTRVVLEPYHKLAYPVMLKAENDD